MNNYSVYAWLDDLQMSTQLIKFANIHSCDLNFIDNDIIVSKNKISTVLIVDLMRLSENDLNNEYPVKPDAPVIRIVFFSCIIER